MLRRHIVLLIAIRPSDGDVKPGGPLGAFREEQTMCRHRVSSSPFLSSSSHTTQLHYTNSYTYSHPNLNFLQYTIQILVPYVMWSAQAVRDSKNRPQSSSSIRLARNPKRIIVKWVGIETTTIVLLLFASIDVLMYMERSSFCAVVEEHDSEVRINWRFGNWSWERPTRPFAPEMVEVTVAMAENAGRNVRSSSSEVGCFMLVSPR